MAARGDDVRVVSLEEIESVVPRIDAVAAMERAFLAYSSGRATVPPVAEILFADPPGEAHVKAGYVAGDAVFVVKVATGFYGNATRGLSSSSGLMLAFDATTGFPKAVLFDGGRLTDLRTAAAGALAAKLLAPRNIQQIAIIGSGIQARLQASLLRGVTSCRRIALWARDAAAMKACAEDIAALGFAVATAASPAGAAANADLIVTCTASRAPLLRIGDVKPGTHITAVGADSEGKQELDAALVARADVVAADSLAQVRLRGDIAHALAAGMSEARVVELGALVAGTAKGRTRDDQITIADLTGVAVQDIEIAKAVLAELEAA
jgi:ornithine cyclodeaminase